MTNLLGLGVFGTFGQPHGFQQAFSQDIHFNQSLDLDSNEIEMFPNTELFAVKREVVKGVYSICFCMYSYAREMNANRSTTFLGSAIVLQQVYVEPEKIYKLLRELHEDIINNTQNLNNNTIQARQAVHLVVTEPAQFQTIKFAAKSIDETPYYSTNVDDRKKYFIKTEHIESASQVISFFDEALKNFNDVGTLYFTFSEKVINSVANKGVIKTLEWEEFVNYKNLQPQDIVMTKRGLKPVPTDSPVAPTPGYTKPGLAHEGPAKESQPTPDAALPQTTAPEPVVASEPVSEEPSPATYDPDFPFSEWSVPNSVWPVDELQKRVGEYNRLVAYSKRLQTHNDALQEQWRTRMQNDITGSPTAERGKNTDPDPAPKPQSFFGEIPINNVKQQRNTEPDDDDETEQVKQPFYKKRSFLWIAIAALLFCCASFYLVVKKHIIGRLLHHSANTSQTMDTTKPVELNHTADTISHGQNESDSVQQPTSSQDPQNAPPTQRNLSNYPVAPK